MDLLNPLALPLPWALLAGLVAGLGIGLAHFASLGRNLRLFRRGRTGWGFALLGARLLLTAALLALLVKLGIGAVGGGLAGILLARHWIVRRFTRERHSGDRRGTA